MLKHNTTISRKGDFEIINDDKNVFFPYCLIYHLGKYMNINIYTFSNAIDINTLSESEQNKISENLMKKLNGSKLLELLSGINNI